MEIETLYRCIDKYLAGKATEAEINKIDKWYESLDRMPGFTQAEKQDAEKNGALIFFQLITIPDRGQVILNRAKWN